MNNNSIESSDSKKDLYNCGLTVVNLLDELDWVVGCYGKPTSQFLYSLNTFVETYVLIDHIFVSSHDAFHLNLIQPFFPKGRPILETLVKDKELNVIVENLEHLRDDTGVVIYTFEVEKGKTPDGNGRSD